MIVFQQPVNTPEPGVNTPESAKGKQSGLGFYRDLKINLRAGARRS
jgi:hypothetical protein